MKILIPFLFAISAFAQTTPWKEKFNSYVKGLPKDVISLLERQAECEHWGGEEPYDEARQKEILAAVTKLKCDSLDADKTKISKKYKKDRKVSEKIKKFPSVLQ